ncbi:MAG: DNA polymerase III subunit delta, partial [Nitrospirae bacterium]|nr:DNA polymerase III subunit delta [Nitrospirota bacterium]
MAVLKYPEFLKRLQKAGKPVLSGVEGVEPLYLFYGEERFLVEEGVQRLKEKVLDPATVDFNLSLFREEDRSAARVTDAALTFPVMSPMRMVVVHGVDSWPKGEMERLSAYFSNPSPTTCLVLTAGKVDERKSSLFSAVSLRGTAVSCPPLFERELEGWISARLRKAGKTASSDAVAFWTASIGSDLHRLAAELDKSAAFVGERKEITEEDTAQLTAGGRQVSAFEFVAALGGRDVRAALPLLKKALDGGVPVEILGVILWN